MMVRRWAVNAAAPGRAARAIPWAGEKGDHRGDLQLPTPPITLPAGTPAFPASWPAVSDKYQLSDTLSTTIQGW